jgi:lipid II:glycine glycyltransferase (peptidoglycan interpeptide bridge formation enzyme)
LPDVAREARTEDRERWDSFVVSQPEGDPLQAWAWGEAHAGSPERPIRWLVENGDGRIRAVMQVLARPAGFGRGIAYSPHGPLWDRDVAGGEAATAAAAAVIRVAREYLARDGAIVLKSDPRSALDADSGRRIVTTLEGLGFRRARYDLQAPTTRIVDLLDGGEPLMASWHADARRLSKRAEREGVTVDIERTGSAQAVDEFQAILEATAERGDFRARSRSFLQRAANAFAKSSGWYTVLARHDRRAIAGMALPRIGDRAYYLYGASLKEPELKHKYGAYAAMAAAMKALAADGVRTLDMWGVVEPDDPDADPAWQGFSAFKRTFGGHPLRHPGTFDLVLDPFWYRVRDLRETLRGRLGR